MQWRSLVKFDTVKFSRGIVKCCKVLLKIKTDFTCSGGVLFGAVGA